MTDAMQAVVLPLWPVLGASCVAGLPFGVLGWREHVAGFWGRLGLILLLLALIAALALAVSGRVPGRAGLWLEIGAASLASYLVGCLVGCLVRALWPRIPGRSEAAVPPA